MYQASTPTNTFTISNGTDWFKEVTVTYLQNRQIVFEKTIKDFTVTETAISHELTQDETISFSPYLPARIEFLFLSNDDKVIPYVIENVPIEEIINKKRYDI
jgi:hypothetical protein